MNGRKNKTRQPIDAKAANLGVTAEAQEFEAKGSEIYLEEG
ncbi:MAG: hypothetical protein AAGF15_11790 [Pseudomonadota bacterium]